MPARSDRAWTGRSGRKYTLRTDEGGHDGGMASIREVLPSGAPRGSSTIAAGTIVALKLARADDPLAVEAIGREAETFAALCRAPGPPPCPRLYDTVGDPVVGLVMEWCPTDMERWWAQAFAQPAALLSLFEALADTCRRVREYEAVAELELGRRVIHADIKPRNVLRAQDGRWLLTDFGAAKSRSTDDASWDATRMIIGTENFIAPEALFNARKPHPAAMDTWSIGCTFLALLKMSQFLAGGGRMPANGTHSHHFRSQRVALIGDLHQRKPAIFADSELDISQFASPERIPQKDRSAVAEAIKGAFGAPAERLEEKLVGEVLNLLDRALMIDPARRYTDPAEMAGEFEALATRYRELALRVQASGPTGSRVSAPAVAPPEVAAARQTRDDVVVVEEPRPGAARVPGWIGAALLAVLAMQLVQVLVGIATMALLWREAAPAVAVAPAVAPEPVTAVAPVTAAAPEPILAPEPASEPPPPPATLADVAAATPEPEPVAEEPPAAAPAPPPKATVKSPPPSKPSPTPLPAASSEWGLVIVAGAQSYLVGSDGRRPPGSVPAGSYELFAQSTPEAPFSSEGSFTVSAGERVVFKCGFGSCRRTQ